MSAGVYRTFAATGNLDLPAGGGVVSRWIIQFKDAGSWNGTVDVLKRVTVNVEAGTAGDYIATNYITDSDGSVTSGQIAAPAAKIITVDTGGSDIRLTITRSAGSLAVRANLLIG